MRISQGFAVVTLVALGCVVLAALFVAYQHPVMLVDFANLLFCG
jgi:hypothetical protein